MLQHLYEAGCQITLVAPRGLALESWKPFTDRIFSWNPPVCNWAGGPLYSTYAFEASWDRFFYNFIDFLLLPARLNSAYQIIKTELVRGRFDVVYVNSLALFPLAGMLATSKSQYGFRLIWQIREVLNEKLAGIVYSSIARSVARAADRVVGISSVEAKAFQPYGSVDILHNSVSPTWERPANWPGFVPGPLRVAMAGAYRPSKGVGEFIRMAELVAARVSDAEFFLFSPHPIPLRYHNLFDWVGRLLSIFSEKLATSLNLVKNLSGAVIKNTVNLTFDHPLSYDDYRRITVYVRSDNSGSPWGRDVIEAMWAGVPVVATGTIQEFVLDGETGFLVPPGNAEMLAERVACLLQDPALRCRMAEAAYQRAGMLFDPYQYGQCIREIFGLEPS